MGDRRTPWLGREENEPKAPKKKPKKKKKPVRVMHGQGRSTAKWSQDDRHLRFHKHKDHETPAHVDRSSQAHMWESRREAEYQAKERLKREAKEKARVAKIVETETRHEKVRKDNKKRAKAAAAAKKKNEKRSGK